MNKNKAKFTVLSVLILLAALAFSYLLPDRDTSMAERRKLKQFPKISLQSIWNGQFEAQIEPYLLDQLPARPFFLNLQFDADRLLFLSPDNNDIIETNGSLISLEQIADEKSLQYAMRVFNSIYQKDLKDSDVSIYFAIIPDKGYFVQDSKYAFMDYEAFMADAYSMASFARPIDLRDTLALEDYYRSDSHWNQIHLQDTAQKLALAMNRTWRDSYEVRNALEGFNGVYASQSGFDIPQDSLDYLWDDSMKDWTITSYASGKPVTVPLYNEAKLEGMDPYEFFMDGNPGMITIENPDAPDGELVIFRDSFGSSIAPLLAQSYSKVTLIDLRQISASAISRYITFTDQDVLFLYSTSVLNASAAIKQ